MNINYSYKRFKKKNADYFNCLQGKNVWQREEGGLFHCPCQLSCKNLRIQRLYAQQFKIRPVTVSKETLNKFTHGTGPVVSKLIIYCKETLNKFTHGTGPVVSKLIIYCK